MEASLISFLLDKLDGIVVDKAQITPQIHTRIDRIKAEFKVMKVFLESSIWSTTAPANKPLEYWMEQVRTVAFRVEDIIDECLHLVEEQRELTWKDYLSRPLILCSNLSEAWHGIDSGLEKTENEILDLLNKRVGFGLTISGDKDRVNLERDTHPYRASSPMIIDEDDVVGIEENKSKLLSWLTDADTPRKMTAIVVWGMGGQGKTTLVSNVYRHNTVKSHFDCQVWITVSQTNSVEELLRTMIQEIFKAKMEPVPNDITNMPLLKLFDIIWESLQQKRYIIVLDDVWHGDLWNRIHDAFVDSNNGSRVIVTTRKHEVARTVNEEQIIDLEQLNKKNAWILFCKKAFRRENNNACPQKLENYARRILDWCPGSPLAIAAIGSLLSFKGKSETEWKKVHDHLYQEFEKNRALDKMKEILDLSFNDLPYYLKNCFVYCSIFPEDYLIRRKKLIRLWVAEGFVAARSSDRSMEDEAEDYLAELVDRSILQVVDSNGFGTPKAFGMHDEVRKVTLAISKKAKFCLNLNGSPLDDQTRRLSIQTNDTNVGDFHNLSSRIPGLRSLVAFDTSNLSSLRTALISSEMLRKLDLERVSYLRAALISSEKLRVLDLERVSSISDLPNEVSALFNLHYLCLRKTRVKQLPNNIQKLQNLQTLDLHYTDIVKLPRGVTKWKQLRHLFVPKIEVEFEGTWQYWNSLQTLKCVRADKNLMQRLGDMKELRSLGVVEVKQAHCSQLCTSLTQMKNLRSLLLSASHGEQLDFGKLNLPPRQLQKLNLFWKLFEGKLPRFIPSCVELTRLVLYGSGLKEDPLPSIGQLPKLVELRLEQKAFDGQILHFKTGWFLNLKRLILEGLINLNRIVIEKDAMINLRELYMADLMELKMFPPGIEFLTHLQSLELLRMPEQLMGKLRKDSDNDEDRRRIKHIPRVTIG